MPRLKMLRGPEPGQIYELDDDVVKIGRGRRNNIIIHDNEVSREHCKLVRVLDVYEVHDNGSTNGTFVNGQRINEGGWLLSARHIIELGDSITLEFLTDNVIESDDAMVISNLVKPVQDDKFYLVIRRVSQVEPEIYLLESETISIGRNLDNDIVLQEPEVSRHHMTLYATDNGYEVEDHQTLNGTMVNERRLRDERVSLTDNDSVRIGTMVEMWYTSDPTHLENLLTEEHELDESGTVTVRRHPGARETSETNRVESDIGSGLKPEDLLNHVFIAYDRNLWDDLVAPLFVYFQDNGIPCWVEQYLTPDSEDWTAAIEQAQSECVCLLAVISEQSLNTAYVQRSIRHFIAREKPILLLSYENVDRLPMMIQKLPAVTYNPDNPERTYRTLLAEISKLNVF